MIYLKPTPTLYIKMWKGGKEKVSKQYSYKNLHIVIQIAKKWKEGAFNQNKGLSILMSEDHS
jgi:hypothetical protein